MIVKQILMHTFPCRVLLNNFFPVITQIIFVYLFVNYCIIINIYFAVILEAI